MVRLYLGKIIGTLRRSSTYLGVSMPTVSAHFRDLPCDVFLPDCPARSVLTLLAEKWSMLILHGLSEGTQRTGALRVRIGGISEKMLIQTLKRLEAASLITRTSYVEVPPRVDYALTELGWSLSPLVKALDQWVEQHAKSIAAGPPS
jgi:DNA-binding HxlR family transcriptional regulator